MRYNNVTTISTIRPLNETKPWYEQVGQLRPLYPTGPIPNVTKEFVFNVTEQYTDATGYKTSSSSGYFKFTLNSMSYQMPSTPPLLASYYDLLDQVHYGPASKPVDLNYNDVVQIVFQNSGKALTGECDQHPWHLHGNPFWVLGYGDGEYQPALHEAQLNLKDPMYLDTVTNFATNYTYIRNTPSYPSSASNAFKPCGWTVVRFVADNPGFWHLHCHIDWDIDVGMGLVFNVDGNMLWENMSLSLPKDYGFCGVIDANTPNPHVTSSAVSTSGCSSGGSTSSSPWQDTGYIIALVFSNLFSFLLGASIVVVVWASKTGAKSFPETTAATSNPIAEIYVSRENTGHADMIA